jgi:hypothetical protein
MKGVPCGRLCVHVDGTRWYSAEVDLTFQADDRFFWNKFLQSRFIDITTSNPDQDVCMSVELSMISKLTIGASFE